MNKSGKHDTTAVVMDALRESQSWAGVVTRGDLGSWGGGWLWSRMRGGSKPNGDLEGAAGEKARRLRGARCPSRNRKEAWAGVGTCGQQDGRAGQPGAL